MATEKEDAKVLTFTLVIVHGVPSYQRVVNARRFWYFPLGMNSEYCAKKKESVYLFLGSGFL